MDLENHMVKENCWLNEVGEEVPFDECAVCGEPLYKSEYYVQDEEKRRFCCIEHAMHFNGIMEVNWN